MAHVSYLSRDDADERLRPIYDDVKKKVGTDLNFFRTMAHAPDLFQGFLGINGAMGKTKLDGKLRELAYLKASDLNGCAYCLHYHRLHGRKAGLNDRQIQEVSQSESSDAYDNLQRDVLRFAEQVTRNVRADDALIGRLRESLSERELVELTMTVALANFTNRVNETLKIDLP